MKLILHKGRLILLLTSIHNAPVHYAIVLPYPEVLSCATAGHRKSKASSKGMKAAEVARLVCAADFGVERQETDGL